MNQTHVMKMSMNPKNIQETGQDSFTTWAWARDLHHRCIHRTLQKMKMPYSFGELNRQLIQILVNWPRKFLPFQHHQLRLKEFSAMLETYCALTDHE